MTHVQFELTEEDVVVASKRFPSPHKQGGSVVESTRRDHRSFENKHLDHSSVVLLVWMPQALAVPLQLNVFTLAL